MADCRIFLGDMTSKHYITAVDFTEVFSWLIRRIIKYFPVSLYKKTAYDFFFIFFLSFLTLTALILTKTFLYKLTSYDD